MVFNYYVIAKAAGFRRDNTVSGANTVPWPAQADRFYSRKLAERRCRTDLGEFIMGPYLYDDGGLDALVDGRACPHCGALPRREK